MTASLTRIYLPALAQRWHQSPEQIVEMAMQGRLRLWLEFNNVLIHRLPTKKGKRRSVRPPAPVSMSTIELQLSSQALAQLHGRCDRMLIAAELSCLDADGEAVTVSNSLGEEWGEVSMLGLKPQDFYARTDEVQALEAPGDLRPEGTPTSSVGAAAAEISGLLPAKPPASLPGPANHPGHPCFAPELEAALLCWQALFAPVAPEAKAPDKVEILAWLQTHRPALSKTAMNRIATLVLPRPSRPSAATRRKEN